MGFKFCQNCGTAFCNPGYRRDVETDCLCPSCRTGEKCDECGSCIAAKSEEDQAVVIEEVTRPTCINPYCSTDEVEA